MSDILRPVPPAALPALPKRPRFSGVERNLRTGEARLYLPGQAGFHQVKADVYLPGKDHADPIEVEMTQSGDYWEPSRTVPLGSDYLFKVKENPQSDWQPYLDLNESRKRGDVEVNHVSELTGPQKATVMFDTMPSSLRTQKAQAEIRAANGGVSPMPNHFDQLFGTEQDLLELLPELEQLGFTAIMLKPPFGGDNTSRHKYWPVNPYVLNNSITGKPGFQELLKQGMRRNMKVFADGAYVNQGLSGLQYMSLMRDGFRSPYWNQFIFDKDLPPGEIAYPKHAYEKLLLGLLPTRLDKATGDRVVDHSLYELRIINDPDDKQHYVPAKDTFLELIPRQEFDEDGNPKKPSRLIKTSEDSVQKQRIWISPEDLRTKKKLLARLGANVTLEERNQVLIEGRATRLGDARADDAGFKWDGKIDVAKMNMNNEDVREYIKGSMVYWSRMAMNAQTEAVARALHDADAYRRSNGQSAVQSGSRARRPEQVLKLIEKITWAGDTAPAGNTKADRMKILPPTLMPDVENLTPEEIAVLTANNKSCSFCMTSEDLAGTVLKEYPLAALGLPETFMASLTYTGLAKALRGENPDGKMPLLYRAGGWLATLLSPLAMLPWVGASFRNLQHRLKGSPFQARLAETLEKVLKELSPEAREKLQYTKMQSLMSEPLAEMVYHYIFAGIKPGHDATPQQLEDGLYGTPGKLGTVPVAILKADPVQAAGLLPKFMKDRLKKLDTKEIARQLETRLATLDPQLAVVAEAVVQKREMGLNWRIDAAKDVAETHKVYDADKRDRPTLFKQMNDFVLKFWSDTLADVRKIFPQVSVIAEVTDYEMLAGDDKNLAAEEMARLFREGIFTATPNMRYAYSQPHRVVYYSQNPAEFHSDQISPGEFVADSIEHRSRALPFPAQAQAQILTSSHDFAASSHALMVHPAMAMMDYFAYWGLIDDLGEAGLELLTKACFAETQKALGIPDSHVLKVLESLRNSAKALANGKQLPQSLLNYFDEDAKKGKAAFTDTERREHPTPFELKPQFVDELFRRIPLEGFGVEQDSAGNKKPLLNEAQKKLLGEALKKRISEPSQARAMRAVIVNAILDMKWSKLPSLKAAPPLHVLQFTERFQAALWQALDKAIAGDNDFEGWGRHFGYQEPELALANVFEQLDPQWREALPAGVDADALLKELRNALCKAALKSVPAKMRRVFAVQNAMPGSPSVYQNDLFVQGGGELQHNFYVQNRGLVRVDKLDDPEFREHLREVGRIFNARKKERVYHDGMQMAARADDANGIVADVRDNGSEQLVTLINTGKPAKTPWWQKVKIENGTLIETGKVGAGAGYSTIELTQPEARECRVNLSHLQRQKGQPPVEFVDIHNGDVFRLNKEGYLVNKRTGKSIVIKTDRVLKRINLNLPSSERPEPSAPKKPPHGPDSDYFPVAGC